MALDTHVVWDMEDDPDGNVQHIREHGLSMDDVEDVLLDPHSEISVSRSSGEPIAFGYTSQGVYIAVVFEHIDDDPLTLYPITAYEAPEPG